MATTTKQSVLKSVNPYNGETLKTYQEMTPEKIDGAVAKAYQAYQQWRQVPIAERAKVLQQAAQLFRERREDLAKLMTLEMGKALRDSLSEVDLCAGIFKYYAEHGETLLAPQKLNTEDGEGLVIHQPIGVVYGIQPWNYPLYQPSRFAAPNLVAGNVVLTKHASNVPQCAEAIETLLRDAGFPEGVYTNLVISSRAAGQVIDDDRVQGVSFTGSNAAGARVAEQAGRNVKKSVLELGGIDPFIVLDDANLDLTVERFYFGKFHNTGQSCVASKRIIVHESVADEFLSRIKKMFEDLQPGDPLNEDVGYGPLCTLEAAKQLEDQINRSVAAGAKVVVGGKRDGAFIEPTILTNVAKGTPAYDEELFGPVAAIFVVSDEDEAVEVANDTIYGLGGSIYTKDKERGQKIAKKIDAGMVFVNHPAWTYPSMPFGGVKKSGYGRELGPLGILEFVNKKLIRNVA